MIKRLHLLVFKSYIGPLIMTFLIAEFVLIMHFLWLYIGDLVGKGLEWAIIAELIMYASAGLVKMALPLAILLSSIMTFGSFGENFELSAMKSAGISLQRIMLPLTLFSVILCFGLFFFSNHVVPYTNLKFGSLLYDVGNQNPEMNIKPGIFNRDIDGFSIKIKSKSKNSNMMYGFMVYDHMDRSGNTKVTLADSGTMNVTDDQKFMVITLYNGKFYEEMTEKKADVKLYPEHHDYFDERTVIFEIPSADLERTSPDLFKHHHQMQTINQLEKSIDSLSNALEKRRDQFYIVLNKTKFFKYGRKSRDIKDSLLSHKDSLYREMNPEKMTIVENFDSVFSKMPDYEKEIVLKSVIENTQSIKKYIESNTEDIRGRKKNIRKHNIAWHEKFTLSFACLIFFFIGAPLGAIIRKGGFGLPFIVSIVFFIIYYVISVVGKKYVEGGVLEPWAGMWLSSLLTLPLGVLFTYKATSDSALFDVGSYIELLKRPFKVLEIQFKDPSVVFHKDIEIPENSIIRARILAFEKLAITSIFNFELILKSFNSIYFRHFSRERSELMTLIDEYNSLYNIVSVKYRDKKFVKANLEKFPKIDKEKYEITELKLKGNYILLTIGIFPFGLLVLLNSYLKTKVLKQKIEIVVEQFNTFKDML